MSDPHRADLLPMIPSDETEPYFVLTIHTRTIGFGENRMQENHAVAKILRDAAHRIQSGHGPIALKDNAGNDIASYRFEPGMLNHSTSKSP